MLTRGDQNMEFPSKPTPARQQQRHVLLAAVADAGNFARAGELLSLTPSGVSRAVGRLEARIGVRLFDRTPRSMTLS